MAGEGALLIPVASPFPPPHTSKTELNWGEWGESENQAVQSMMLQIQNCLGTLQKKTAFHQHGPMFALAPTMVGRGRPGCTGPSSHRPAGEESCRNSPRSRLHMRGEGERQIKAVPSSTAPR